MLSCNRFKLSVVLTLIFSLAFISNALAVNISGALRDMNGNPIREDMRVGASQNQDDWTEVETANGQYTIAGLEPGGYYVRAEPSDPESWLLRTYYPQTFDEDDAEYIWVGDQNVDNIDIIISAGGRFSGSISVEGGGQLPGDFATIAVYDDPNNWFEPLFNIETEQASDYTSMTVPPGDYLVKFSPAPGDDHAAIYYGNSIVPSGAEWVSIESQSTTENISGQLPMGGQISGSTYAGEELQPYTTIIAIYAQGMDFMILSFGMTDMQGEYVLHGIPAGECFIQFMPSSDEYCNQWYRRAYSLSDATPVVVRAGEIAGNINAYFERGAGLNGTILKPDQSPLGQWEGWIDLLGSDDIFGSNAYIEMTEDGVWQTEGMLAPGVYTLRVESLADPMIAGQFYNGAQYSWDAHWMYMGPGMNTPPLVIQLQEGAMIHGTITTPNGVEIGGVDINLMDEYGSEHSASYNEGDGAYEIGNITPGSYYLRASPKYNEEVGLTEANALVTTYSGNVYLRDDADWFDVVAGSNQEVNITLGRGGIVHATASGPGGRIYDMMSDGVGVIVLAIDADGNPLWDAATPSGDDGPPAVGEEGADYVLPAGSYTAVGVPIFIGSDINDAPAVRRTFLGGGFDLQGAQRINVVAGQTVQAGLEMVETGFAISGTAQTTAGKAGYGVTAIVDANGDIVSAFMPSFMGITDREGSWTLKGMPNGSYRVFSWPTDESHIITTWYPNVGDPGRQVENLVVPNGAGAVVVNNADVVDVAIVLQLAENYTGVKERPPFSIPAEFALHGAFPNPFNSSAVLLYSLNKTVDVKLTLTDVLGREVAVLSEGRQAPGIHSARINGESLSNGVYFARMEAEGFKAVTKITMMK